MIVERIQLLHEDYIRLTERFKTLWTFQQFLRGMNKTFLSGEPETTEDFSALYEEIRSLGGELNPHSSAQTAPRLTELFVKLDSITSELREVDRNVSTSFVRRFFERVRPQDDKTAFQLLRFYFFQPDVDLDVIDKVNFLATVAAAGSSDPASSAARPRTELTRLFDSVTSASVWQRPSDQEASAVAYVVDEVAAKVARAQTFEELMSRGLLDEFRSVKRKIGASLVHPEVLAAVACGNLAARAAFYRLYRSEERLLHEATGRIEELERGLRRGAGEDVPLPEEIRRFRETREQFERRTLESNVRATDVVRLKTAIGQVLEKFDLKVFEGEEASEPLEEAEAESDDESFWKPLVDRILAVVEIHDDGRGALRTDMDGLVQLRLEPWELKGARRVVASMSEPKNDQERTLLKAVALRWKAEQETELLRTTADEPRPLETLRRARASIAHAPELDRKITHIIGVANDGGLSEQARAWTRTRFRLLRAIADLWLMQDQPRSDRRSR